MTEWDSFDALEAHIWGRLSQAVAHSDDPWRFVTLATVGPGGPAARLVGLRASDRDLQVLEVHTDSRTAKVTEIGFDPRAQLLFWDPGREEQLRVSVRMSVIEADPDGWDRVPQVARGNYGTDPAPGVEIPEAEAYARRPERARFAALRGRVAAMDAVLLRSDPHRRAMLRNGSWRWVAP